MFLSLHKKPKHTDMKKTENVIIKQHNTIFRKGCSGIDTKVIHLTTPIGKKVFKFSYENGNAFEHFKCELFNGETLVMVCNLTDLGLSRNTSGYHLFTEVEFKQRVKELTDRGIKFIENLF